ncbi:MAG TPA: M56 family metallopeptidase [Edaphobacter sp.]|nr:M56 family metallopeptidase [Edaphobacter sp.]
MNVLEEWVAGYVLNSLWMVPLVFGLAWLVARGVRGAGPKIEHRVWVGALMLETILPACQMRWSEAWSIVRQWLHRQASVNAGDTRIDVAMSVGKAHPGVLLPQWISMGLLLMYAGCLLYFAARLTRGLWNAWRIRRGAQRLDWGEEEERIWERRCEAFAVDSKRVEVGSSLRIDGPVTMGIRRAALLFPTGFLSGVTKEDLDAVMAHECAHILRYDFLKNLLYNAFALPMSYHPLLHRTLSRVEETREMICDAMAAEAIAGRESYAKSLLRLALLMVERKPARTLHAIGIFDDNSFERRVMSLTGEKIAMGRARRLVMIAVCAMAAVVTCGSAVALRMDVGVKKEAAAPIKVKASVIASNLIYDKHPVYPAEAKEKNDTVDGPVVLEAIISKEGFVKDLRVKQSLRPDYDRSALDAVREWRYRPYMLNGEPTEVETTITVNYSIGK